MVPGNSLAVQWLGLWAFTAGAWVQSLVRELSSYKPQGTAKGKKACGTQDSAETRVLAGHRSTWTKALAVDRIGIQPAHTQSFHSHGPTPALPFPLHHESKGSRQGALRQKLGVGAVSLLCWRTGEARGGAA